MGKEIQSHDEEVDAQKARAKDDDVAFQKVHCKRKDNTKADNKTDPGNFLQWACNRVSFFRIMQGQLTTWITRDSFQDNINTARKTPAVARKRAG
jgi:hypothetical protein